MCKYNRKERCVLEIKLPDEFKSRMRGLTGDEFDKFIDSYNTQINKGIRINTLKYNDTQMLASELGVSERVLWCDEGYYIKDGNITGNHPYHASGALYFQEPSAMSVAVGLPIGESDKILDLCAAPGGKTTHIAARMKNKGLLISNEIVPKRAAILAENIRRMGITNTIVTNETPSRLAQHFEGYFDSIVVDAPCSGEGMFRKEPQAVDEWSVAHTLSCAQRQKNILDDAYKMLRCGGYIMYSTCTFSYDENEAVVRYMLDKYNMQLCHIPELDMLSGGIGDGMENCRRIFPHRHNGEGHFAALLRKTEPAECEPEKPAKSKPANSLLLNAVKLYRDFEKKFMHTKCEGEFVLFGDNLYLMPQKVNIDKLKVTQCGLHLGIIKRDRFEPSYALSHAFGCDAYLYKVETKAGSDEIKRYMHGDVLNGDINGWCVITCDKMPVGWGKGSGGVIKNHYPKALRTV